MPYQPWQLGVHRTASIALFRALLSRSKTAQINDEARNALQNVVRNTFKRYRFEHSRVRLATFFQEGYEAITLLKASSNGDPKATSTILTRLASAFPKSKDPPPLNALQKRIIKRQLKAASAKAAAQKPKVDFLDTRSKRVLDSDKPRRIPQFVNASGIPMLRVKKPQPETLSGYIRKRLATRQRRKLQIQAFESEHKRLADDEDAWEAIIKSQGILEAHGAHMTTYKAGVNDVLREIGSRITMENKKHLIFARRMQKIVVQERRLALREKRRRRRGRWRVNVRLRKAAGAWVGKREKKDERGESKRRGAQLPSLTRQEADTRQVGTETDAYGGHSPRGVKVSGGMRAGNRRIAGKEKSGDRGVEEIGQKEPPKTRASGGVTRAGNQKPAHDESVRNSVKQPTQPRASRGAYHERVHIKAGSGREEGGNHGTTQVAKAARGSRTSHARTPTNTKRS